LRPLNYTLPPNVIVNACLIIRLLYKMESTNNHKSVADSNIDDRANRGLQQYRLHKDTSLDS